MTFENNDPVQIKSPTYCGPGIVVGYAWDLPVTGRGWIVLCPEGTSLTESYPYRAFIALESQITRA